MSNILAALMAAVLMWVAAHPVAIEAPKPLRAPAPAHVSAPATIPPPWPTNPVCPTPSAASSARVCIV